MQLKHLLIWLILAQIPLGCTTSEQEKQLELANSYGQQVVQLYREGKARQAVQLAEQALKIQKEILGDKHPDTLQSLNNLAFIYQAVGRLTEALPLLEQGYRLRQEVLGDQHPDTLTGLNNLAGIYDSVGRRAEALPLAEQGYRLSQEVLGDKHPQTLGSLNNLASIYDSVGRLTEALPLKEQCYRLRQEVLGDKHPDTLTSLNNLAGIYKEVGRLAEALPLAEQGYRLSQEVLGDKHPQTLGSLNNLASIYDSVGRLTEALPLKEQCYRLRQEVLGDKHPDTLTSLNNLAGIYKEVGRLAEALPLSEQCYRLSQEVLGDKHPFTLTSLNNLAMIYQAVGRRAEALPLLEQGYRLSQEVLGDKHPDTLSSLNNLAFIYDAVGRLAEALPLSEQGYRLRQEVLGDKHPDTLQSLNNLAFIYQAVGRLAEALPLYEQGYRLSQEVLGDKHPNTLTSLNNLAMINAELDNPDQAINLFEQLLTQIETLRATGDLSVEDQQTLFAQWTYSYFNLTQLYRDHQKPDQAFHTAEKTKARTLLETMTTKLAVQRVGLTTAEQQQLDNYQQTLASLNDHLAKVAHDLKQKLPLEEEKRTQVKQLAEFHRQLQQRYPKYAQLNQVQLLTAKEGAPLLPKDALFISYLVGTGVNENLVLAFTLDHTATLHTYDLGKIPNLDETLETYRVLLSLHPKKLGHLAEENLYLWQLADGHCVIREKTKADGNPQKVTTLAQLNQCVTLLAKELGQRLLAPLQDDLRPAEHWIISPDGRLAQIPFETLLLDEKPVISKHYLSYAQSLSVFGLLKQREQTYQALPQRQTLFAMGNPFYHDPQHPPKSCTESLANLELEAMTQNRQENYQGAEKKLAKQTLCNLKSAKPELEALRNLFSNGGFYEGDQATEANLWSLNQDHQLMRYQNLFFSVHGYLSPDFPALSALLLGQLHLTPSTDGLVTASEWVGYDLRSDLMFLSACETGLGQLTAGEGILGLPYALYIAGNKNTILTLWSIFDEAHSTADFTRRFFSKVKAGQTHLQALTETKREFLKEKDYQYPAFWAGFVLYGV